jgi:hypothetical protein
MRVRRETGAPAVLPGDMRHRRVVPGMHTNDILATGKVD